MLRAMLWLSQLDWALFMSAFISSTLFPGGSEALLLYRLQESDSNIYLLIWIATLGNVLGSIVTYGIGRLGIQFGKKWLRISDEATHRAEQYFQRFGTPALLFAWLPIVGDPLCLVAGTLRYNFIGFVMLVSIGKLMRYTFLVWAFL